jgi:predicted nucleic acid-binding protein
MLNESFDLRSPSAADFSAAAKYLGTPKTGLRAGDALHLAIAASHWAKEILTLTRESSARASCSSYR